MSNTGDKLELKHSASSGVACADRRNMIFISHANPEDNKFAEWLALRLAREGYPVWCDVTKLLGGEDFWRDIEAAIRERTIKFLFVLSKCSNEKQGTLMEVAVARKVGIPVRRETPWGFHTRLSTRADGRRTATSSASTWLTDSSCRTCRRRTSRPSSRSAIKSTLSFVGTSTKTFPTASWSCQTAKRPLRLRKRSRAEDGARETAPQSRKIGFRPLTALMSFHAAGGRFWALTHIA